MSEFEGRTDEELRAMGRAHVERIAQIADIPGLAQDEVMMRKQQANRILAELRRRRGE